LGEYSALAAAGALTVGDAARLLRARGRAMQEATPVGLGAMAALLGLDFATASEVAAEAAQGQVCQAANDNDPAQVVVSGHREAVERAVEIAKAKGAKRAVLLPVSAPFHCALMQPAADAMAEALAGVEIRAPQGAGGVERAGRGCERPGGDPRAAGRADHRVGALARVGRMDGRAGRDRVLGDRRGQGAVGHGPADRAGRGHAGHRHAG
jgi:malonyl CoA-acyl carrier protein transacylase